MQINANKKSFLNLYTFIIQEKFAVFITIYFLVLHEKNLLQYFFSI